MIKVELNKNILDLLIDMKGPELRLSKEILYKKIFKIKVWSIFTQLIGKSHNKLMVEFPAGLIDPGETAQTTALRELYEETGAVEFSLVPVCVYSVVQDDGDERTESFGKLYYAEVEQFEEQLHSEIEL